MLFPWTKETPLLENQRAGPIINQVLIILGDCFLDEIAALAFRLDAFAAIPASVADVVAPSAAVDLGRRAVSSFEHALYPAAAEVSDVPDSAYPSASVAVAGISGPSSHSQNWRLPATLAGGH